MSENNRKDFDMEEDPFAGVPDFDPALGWGDEEIYDLVLSARDISCLEGRTDISADDLISVSSHFDVEGKHEKAALCLTKAAELGDVLAKYYLAERYEDGKGVVQDYVKAAELYMEVSNCNEILIDHDFYPKSWSKYAVGSFYERGLLPDSTMEKAVEWYLRAEKEGSNEAAYKLAECYHSGKGVKQNYDMAAEKLYSAHHWSNGHDARSFTLAKALDGKTETHQLYICKILAECYLKGIGTDKDEEKAHEYHSKAEALEAKLKAETEAWAVSLDDDERPW
ncbi:MAG: SEL1-like repeat protein [Clostridia bacterium]|nr:SEL1-like repeat protein [Clostridia bacterium]